MIKFLRPILTIPGSLCLAVFLSPLVLSGCGSKTVKNMFPDQTLEYKSSREASENLEVPPDLVSGSFDDALDVPSVAGGATYSDYAAGQARRTTRSSSGEVLPEVAGVELERSGRERWLDVNASPQTVWSRVVSFWREQGILLVQQNPTVGTMTTDWLENRAEIRRDFITRMMRKVADGLHSTSTRDQYRVRIDKSNRRGWTEVHLTHTGMSERLVEQAAGGTERTVWEPSGSDSDKEAAMIRRLMLYLGAPRAQADAVRTGATGGSSIASPARLVAEGGGQVLLIADEFRRGWRMTGSALDRAGFTVDDRDRSRGVYYVRYENADEVPQQKKKGWMSRMAFWRKSGVDSVKQYQIQVQGDERQTRVSVLDANGNLDTSASAGTILALLKDQMN